MADQPLTRGRVEELHRARFRQSPTVVAWAPGRVNIIGEHTDYTGGLAMPMATRARVLVALAPLPDRRVEVWSEDFKEEVTFSLSAETPLLPAGWAWYVRGAAAVARGRFPDLGGFRATICGDLPMGAGLSSSAAVELALLNALKGAFHLPLQDMDLIQMGQEVEHRYIGLPSGLLDQAASQLSREGAFLMLDFRGGVSWRHVPVSMEGWALVLADSGTRRELVDGAYRRRVEDCARGLQDLQKRYGIRHLRDLDPDRLLLPRDPTQAARVRHVVEENQRVLRAEEALGRGDTGVLGAILNGSHASLRDLFQVSTPALDALQRVAASGPGAAGARMVGGGFGGCCLCLVRRECLAAFGEHVRRGYRDRTGLEARMFELTPGSGAGVTAARGAV